MAKNNSNLHGAKKAKNDEFYTQLTDIENELRHYKSHFNGKVVLCNCNDALHSNFAKYFSLNFEVLGLKKLICTAYKVDGEHGKVCVYEGDKNGNRVPDLDEWDCRLLEGDGGFASEECIEFLKEADIVVTNPPFSLFREYVALLMEYGKKFLIIGNMNAITYKEIFPLIKENQVWLGATGFVTDMVFGVPEGTNIKDSDKQKAERLGYIGNYTRLGNSCWFTNVDHKKRHEEIDLYKHYTPEEFPKYDNYDAIEVSKVCEIPMDYDGVMGVPITFLGKYCPTQFEIIGFWNTGTAGEALGATYCEAISTGKVITWNGPTVNRKTKYFRILIRRVS